MPGIQPTPHRHCQGLGWAHKVQTNAIQLLQHSKPGVSCIPQTKPSLFFIHLLFICEIQKLVLLSGTFPFLIFLPPMEADICMYSLSSQSFFFGENHSLPHMSPDNETTKQDNSLHDTEMLLMLNQAQNSKRASN